MAAQEKRSQDFGQVILSWQMPEYAHHTKDKRWYMIAGTILLAILVYGLLAGEYIMVLAFALLGAVYYILHNEPPRDITFAVTSLGMIVDRDFYQFSDMESFWIVYNPPAVRVLYLRPARRLTTDIRIELMEQNPMIIRQLLQTQIKEIAGEGESLIDRMTRLLRL